MIPCHRTLMGGSHLMILSQRLLLTLYEIWLHLFSRHCGFSTCEGGGLCPRRARAPPPKVCTCVCVCVCARVCLSVCLLVCVRARARVRVRVHVCTHVRARVSSRARACTPRDEWPWTWSVQGMAHSFPPLGGRMQTPGCISPAQIKTEAR